MSNRNTRNRASVGCLSAPGERSTIKSAAAVSAGEACRQRGRQKQELPRPAVISHSCQHSGQSAKAKGVIRRHPSPPLAE